MENNTRSNTETEWELPQKPRDIDDDLPLDETEIVETATISKDSYGQLFVRFPREIKEVLSLEAGFSLEFVVRKPVKAKQEIRVDEFWCNIVRKVKKRGRKKKVSKNASEKKS
ncbi:MAG: hypothetical protein JXC85_05755 [Candidatus Aenigmarchaeota archaeon]|nr:hypothetical protein [Candidatus Aenigmarchaeota archaeon]